MKTHIFLKGRHMERNKKEKINTIIALINQLVTVICGFVLPRFYLKSYGSEVYGLINSISQFLGFVTLMELGIGAVVQSSLYKPLADKDEVQTSNILSSADKFFKKIAIAFLGYAVVLALVYPTLSKDTFSWWFDASLILIISISSFAEYFFGITYRLLLLADQKAYVTYGFASIGIVANFFACIIAMQIGCSIHTVKLVSTFVMLLRPVGQYIYVNHRYRINKKAKYSGEPIKQKWNGIAQHLAYYITNNTDTIVLTVFSTLKNVAIYSVYNIIVNGFRQLILTLNSGTKALYGEMIVRNEREQLLHHFLRYEIMIHAVVILAYSCISRLILPFVSVYTSGINDVNYSQPVFALLISAAHAAYCIRLPYNTLVNAAGHYKQTQKSAIIEMVLNLGISIALVSAIGLVGVAIGTLVALLYRTIYLAWYSKKIVPEYRFSSFIRNIIADLTAIILFWFLTEHIPMEVTDYGTWIVLAVKIFAVSLAVVAVVNILFNGKVLYSFVIKFRNNEQDSR